MSSILSFFNNHSTTIKDFFTILFTSVATIVAVLTYRRAKATILQPKRNELIKKQTELFSNFLTSVNSNENSIDHGLDYTNLLSYNVELVLRDFGLIEIAKDSEQYLEYNYNIAGWIQFLENDIHDFIYSKGDITDYDKLIFEPNDRLRRKSYHFQLTKGNFTVHRIFYTKKHETLFKTIREFATNPFLPKEIQKQILTIAAEMHDNIHNALRVLLSLLIKEYYNAVSTPTEENKYALTTDFRHKDLYRMFENNRIKHTESYDTLKNLIRDHMGIDEKW